MAADSEGANTAPTVYKDVDGNPIPSFPDASYIRNGRAQLVVSRSIDAQMRVGPQCKKKLYQQQRFGPVGEHTGVWSSTVSLDQDLVGNGFTRAAGDSKEIAPIPRNAT